MLYEVNIQYIHVILVFLKVLESPGVATTLSLSGPPTTNMHYKPNEDCTLEAGLAPYRETKLWFLAHQNYSSPFHYTPSPFPNLMISLILAGFQNNTYIK